MNQSLLYILFFVILSNCSVSKNIKETPFIYYGKSSCLGKCPVFDMYIYNNGEVVYKGLQNVALKGEHKFSLSKNQLQEIEEELKKVDFNTKNEVIRDLPTTTLKYNGKKLSVRNKEKIKDLVRLLEKIIE
ncbi:DUF6438 domain-containing protein [uncultured Tenacibaculum sp.]|uniref:DUF6438 domain-containing protein n=1 Tax=uncultured Tenacibaculum sp. TaxID=174713 RepID=UPI00260DD6F3|nr:DUF6438 domain-containing protein [uncultured Tenacibaculum sp.]